MDCSEIRSNLTLYTDAMLNERASADVEAHLVECPLCRESSSQLHEVRNSMRRMARPEIPSSLKFQLKRAIREEITVEKTAWLPVSAATRAWLRKDLMPYAVGTLASVVIGLTVLTSMFSGLRDRNQRSSFAPAGSDTVLLASNRDPFSGGDLVSPSDFAHSRMDVSRESPTVNPQGALIALTKSFVRGDMHDDEVVVVADVFGNGLAQISEVVEPSRDRRAVGELERALASNDPQYAPFVAANLDQRSDSVRVVLKFQSVDVPTRLRAAKPR
jgi:hypothetical protein